MSALPPKADIGTLPLSPSTTTQARTRKVTPTLPTGCPPVDRTGDRISARNFLLMLPRLIRRCRGTNVRFTPKSGHRNPIPGPHRQLSASGGKITGTASQFEDLAAKMIELLHDAAPKAG